MASEYLNSFISLYKEKAQASLDKAAERLKKRQGQLETFNTLRPLLLEEAKTLGFLEDFERLFPENGEGPFFSQADIMTYSSMLESVDDSKQLKAFNKVDSAPKRLKTAEEYLKYAEEDLARDPEEYLAELHGALIKGLAQTASLGGGSIDNLKKTVFEDQDSYEDIIEYTAEEVNGPRGVKTDPVTYAALKEIVDSGDSIESTSSNEAVSPINPESKDLVEEKETSELAEPIEQDEDPSEIEVDASDNLDIPKEDPLASLSINNDSKEKEVKSEPEEAIINEPSKDTKTSEDIVSDKETISIESNQSAPDQEIKDNTVEPEVQSTNVVNNISNIEDTSNEINNVEDNSSINNQVPLKSSEVETSNEQSGGNSFITSFLSSMTGLSTEEISSLTNTDQNSVINNTKSDSNIVNNQSNQASGDAVGDINTESNVTNIDQLNNTPEASSNTPESLNKMESIANNLETNSNFSSFEKSSIISPDPITKEDINSVGKDISTGVSSTIGSVSNAIEESSSNVSSSLSSGPSFSSDSSSTTAPVNSPGKGSSVSLNNDMSQLEKRLKNIEILLMGPLEVKIKN